MPFRCCFFWNQHQNGILPEHFSKSLFWNGIYYSIHLKKSGIAYVLNSFELNSTQFEKDAHVWGCRFAEYVAKMTQIDEID